MAAVNFNQWLVKNAGCEEGKEKTRLYDAKCKGLMLEVRSIGTKTYFLRYCGQRGKYKQVKLGRVSDLTVSQARKLGHKILGDVAMGKDPQEEKKAPREMPTLESFAYESYLPYIKTYKKSWETDESLLRNHILPRFGKMHMDEITREDIMGFHQDKLSSGAAPASANRLVVLMRYMFNLAIEWEIGGIKANPTKGVILAEENNARERYLSEAELLRLHKEVKESENKLLEPIVLLLILTGARKREVLDARWEDIDFERKTLMFPVTKSGKPRTVPLSPNALEILKGLPKVNEFIFPSPKTGKPFVSIFNSWNQARKRAGLEDVRIHDLRHSFASFLVNGGRSIYEVGKLLGHTQIKTTMRYAHLSDQTLMEAVNVVPFGEAA
ncbi:MAG: tyrosine-type recombinase/integrase [bacterium]